MSTIPKSKQAGPASACLKVAARNPAGFRRAGRFFGAEVIEIPLDEITAEDAEAIKTEPALIVIEGEATAAAAPPAKK